MTLPFLENTMLAPTIMSILELMIEAIFLGSRSKNKLNRTRVGLQTFSQRPVD